MTAADPWLTFGPDLLAGSISGLVTGLIVGAILLLAQRGTEDRAAHRADVSAAYVSLLEVSSRLMHVDFNEPGAARIFSELRHRMTVLSELVDDKEPEFAQWMEAERQNSLYRAKLGSERMEAVQARSDATADELLEAGSVYFAWVQAFTGNVRLWRSKKFGRPELARVAKEIEGSLTAKGAWR